MQWIAAIILPALTCVVMGEQAMAAPASRPAPKPVRVMSLKICTDALLLDLVPPQRIASVTFMAHEPAALRQWPNAARVAVNHGSAEEILATRPDLILTDPYMSATMRALLAKTGAKVLEVPPAQTFEQIRVVTRLVAGALGETARGEALIARMDDDLRAVKAHRPRTPIRVAEWGNGGYVPGAGGLLGTMLDAAGGVSIVKGGMGYYDVEALIAADPDVLVYGDTYRGLATLRSDQDNHPALMKRHAGRQVRYASLYGCGVPQAATVTRQLQADLLKAVKR